MIMQYLYNLQIFANYKDPAGSGEFVFLNKTFVVHLLNVCPIFQSPKCNIYAAFLE